MSFHKTAIESLRTEIVTDLNVNYIMDYLVQTKVFTANDRDDIVTAGRAVGDISNPMHRERVIERQTETFLDLMLEKENLATVFVNFVNVLYKDDNYPWLAKRLQQFEDNLEKGDDNVLSCLGAIPSPSPAKKRSSNFEHFKEIYMDEYTSDITIIVGQKRFPAHKFMLFSRSEVFKKMFFDKKGCVEKEIVIYDTKEDAFETMLQYCYGVECDFDDCLNKAIDLYKLSHKFQITCLMTECMNAIILMVDCDNLLVVCEFALYYEINDLLAAIKWFVERNGETILSSKAILTCDRTALEVLATIFSYIALPQSSIIGAIRSVRETNSGADLSPLKVAVDLEKCDVTDIDMLRNLYLFTDRELLDAMRLKYLSLVERSGNDHNM